MKIIPNKFSKTDLIGQIITCLLAVILFLTMLSSLSGPKGKAIGHNNIHGKGPVPMIDGRVNPAGIIVGSGGVKIDGITASAEPGNSSGQNGMSAFNPANFAGNNIALMLNSQGIGVLGNMNKGKGAGGKGLTLAAGDLFSNAISNIDSLSASLTLPDPIGAKGPNPNYGGSHPKKGGGNPGGGNGNGHWGWGNHGNGYGNSYMGNQGHGVGEGMARRGPFGPPEPPEPPDPPDPPEEPVNSSSLYVAAAPLPKEQKPGIEKCPALKELAAQELGMTTDDIQVHLGNVVADCYDIQPCDMYARLVNSASILKDIDGSAITALSKVINELASPIMPISEEHLATISQGLAFYNGVEDKPHYKLAGQWLDALGEYVSILTTDLQWSVDESIAFVGDRYVVPIMEEGDVSLAMFLHLQLQVLGSS